MPVKQQQVQAVEVRVEQQRTQFVTVWHGSAFLATQRGAVWQQEGHGSLPAQQQSTVALAGTRADGS